MNRKAKNIIFWVVIGLLAFIFAVTFVFGIIKTFNEPGSSVYIGARDFITTLGLNGSDFFTYSPYVCVGSSLIACFMFYRKFNTRIN